MKKLITIAFAAVLMLFGAAATPASALTVDDCAESDTAPAGCEDVADITPTEDGVYPVEAPDGGTSPAPTPAPTTAPAPTPAPTVPPAGLPATGSDGASGMLQIGGLLLVGGLVVFVAARRRNPAAAS